MNEDFLIHETEHFRTVQSGQYHLPGYLIIYSKPDVMYLDEFEPAHRIELMECIARAEATLQATLHPERIYWMKFAEVMPRLHVHVVARTAELASACPEGMVGARLIDWLWQHHTELGHDDSSIERFVEAARLQAAQRS